MNTPVQAESIDLNLDEGEFALAFFPLTSGEAALLQTADGLNYLINSGEAGSADEIVYYLNYFQVDTLDGFIKTDRSEMPEKLTQILQNRYEVKKVFGKSIGGKEEDEWRAGTTISLNPFIELSVLTNGTGKNEGMDFSIQHFNNRFFWMTSNSFKAEIKLLKQPLRNINIIKIPDYGQKNSVSYNLLTHIDPQTAIIFQHEQKVPDKKFMEMLHRMWIDSYYSGQHGIIAIKFHKLGYEVITIPSDK
ncbi:beta-lactamase superfamily II metal-dependent hydrolase [Bacillus ectoiniformans]|nr:beta-lactamase superfamily II metal-dependent hydrolase [Bacillus ectoiniformans]